MKRTIIYSLLIIILLGAGFVGVFNKPKVYPSSDILGKIYYKYITDTDSYETITIDKYSVTYTGSLLDLNNCNHYEYDEINEILNMSCGKIIELVATSNEVLSLRNNEKILYYFKDKEKSFNNEFSITFETEVDNYKASTENILHEITIDSDTFENLMNNEEETYVYYRPSNCDNKCLVISHNVHSLTTNTIYYINYLDESIKEKVNELNSNLLNSNKPLVFIIGNGKIKNIIEVNINGLTDNNLYGYVDRIVGELNE